MNCERAREMRRDVDIFQFIYLNDECQTCADDGRSVNCNENNKRSSQPIHRITDIQIIGIFVLFDEEKQHSIENVAFNKSCHPLFDSIFFFLLWHIIFVSNIESLFSEQINGTD